jgi:peptide/nickel transport system substrate-binding protein
MDTLLIGTTDKITHLSPENSYDYWTWHVFGQVSEALVQFKPGTTTIVGQLAQSWRISPTGTAYTFILRKGVTFTDGSPFNAAAVKASLDRILRLKGPEGASGLLENIKSIDVVDDYTVRITLAERDATFLSRMTWGVGAAHIYNFRDAPANDYSEGKFVGTGPYRIAQYAPGERMVFEAYPGYWGDKPKTRQVIEVFFADASALAAAVESGQVDVGFRSFNPQDLLRLRQSPRVTVIQGPSLSVRYLVFNVAAKPFDDVKVRRGIAYAVDRDKIAQNVFGGLNTPLYSMEPPGMWSHIDAFPKRNLDRARSQLSEAGYSQSKKLAIALWYSPTHYGSTEADAAAVVKQAIEESGMVSVDVKSQEWAAYSKAKANGEYGLFFLGWFPDFVDPDNFLTPWLVEAPGPLGTFLHKATSTQDKQYYTQFVKLLGDATRVTSQPLRTKYYEQAQQLLADSAILVPLWSNNNQAFAVTQKNVDGILLTPDMNFRTWTISKK